MYLFMHVSFVKMAEKLDLHKINLRKWDLSGLPTNNTHPKNSLEKCVYFICKTAQTVLSIRW